MTIQPSPPRSHRLTIPCAECGAEVVVAPFLARAGWENRIRCERCVPDHRDDGAVKLMDVWRNRVPMPFRDVTLDGIPDQTTRDWMQRLVEDWPRPLNVDGRTVRVILLRGATGTRKTGTVWAVLHELVASGRVDMNAILAGSEVDVVLPETRTSKWEALKPWKQLHGKEIVFIDDLGLANLFSPEARISVYKDLLDRVAAQDRTLFLTTNLTLPDVRTSIGDAAFSRLQEHLLALMPGQEDTRRWMPPTPAPSDPWARQSSH